MAQNDSHYNQVTNTSGAEHVSFDDLSINVPWITDNNQNSDTNAHNSPFPPINPPSDGVPILPFPPAPTGGNLPGAEWNWGNWNTNQLYGQVRFLNASTNTFDVDISVDGNPYVLNSRFGTISGYEWIADGFHTITVRRSTSIRTILFQQNLPFTANQKITMVLVDSVMGGLEMVRIVDTGCSNLPQSTGCYRFANMSYPGTAYDLLLSNGETIFRNVTYQNITAYKQAVASTYQFSVANANIRITMRELPIIVIGAVGTGTGTRDIVLDYQVTISPGRNYTTYIIGNNWSDFSLRALTVED